MLNAAQPSRPRPNHRRQHVSLLGATQCFITWAAVILAAALVDPNTPEEVRGDVAYALQGTQDREALRVLAAALASSGVPHKKTPWPAASPSAFITTGLG